VSLCGSREYSLACLLLLELNDVDSWGTSAPSWRLSLQTLGTEVEKLLPGQLREDPAAESAAARPTYQPIWEEIIRISSVLIDASLLLRPQDP